MDYEEMTKAYKSATEPTQWKIPTAKEVYEGHMPPPYLKSPEPPVNYYTQDVDYSIVRMPNGTYIVARSEKLGSLDYSFVCECQSQPVAREIVKALNK